MRILITFLMVWGIMAAALLGGLHLLGHVGPEELTVMAVGSAALTLLPAAAMAPQLR